MIGKSSAIVRIRGKETAFSHFLTKNPSPVYGSIFFKHETCFRLNSAFRSRTEGFKYSPLASSLIPFPLRRRNFSKNRATVSRFVLLLFEAAAGRTSATNIRVPYIYIAEFTNPLESGGVQSGRKHATNYVKRLAWKKVEEGERAASRGCMGELLIKLVNLHD